MRFSTLLMLLVALAFPGAALAQGEDVIRDCAQDGDLDGNYSQDELDEAYNNLPSDIDEYSDCRTVIEKARERNDGGGSNEAGSDPGSGDFGGATAGDGDDDGDGGVGGAGNDRQELRDRDQLSESDEAPDANVAGESLTNSGGTIGTDDESDGMPAPLIVAILLAILAAIGGLLYAFREHLPENIASRLPGPPKG